MGGFNFQNKIFLFLFLFLFSATTTTPVFYCFLGPHLLRSIVNKFQQSRGESGGEDFSVGLLKLGLGLIVPPVKTDPPLLSESTHVLWGYGSPLLNESTHVLWGYGSPLLSESTHVLWGYGSPLLNESTHVLWEYGQPLLTICTHVLWGYGPPLLNESTHLVWGYGSWFPIGTRRLVSILSTDSWYKLLFSKNKDSTFYVLIRSSNVRNSIYFLHLHPHLSLSSPIWVTVQKISQIVHAREGNVVQ